MTENFSAPQLYQASDYTTSRISLNYRPLNHHEIGSLVSSLARARFQATPILIPMCRDYLIHLSKNLDSTSPPRFIKIFLERLISLRFHKIEGVARELFFG